MSQTTRDSIYESIASIRLVDPHTHINPHNPGSQTLADILGYHYYTELVHSAGMSKDRIEEDGISPRELVGRLVEGLPNIENTANYQWLIKICKTFFDFQDDRITQSNWESLFDTAEDRMSSAQWPQIVLDKSNVEAVFLTNDFDDDLEGFDTNTYIPCLRTDDLVFHLGKSETRERLAVCSGIEIDGSLESLRSALRQRFEHFVPRGARACAISIPPDFQPSQVADGRAETALDAILKKGVDADPSHHVALSRRVFWTLAELCDEFSLPFDLMIGVNRGVYPGGVYQGQDLYDSRVSLTQYRELFNAFPDVKFPISVLASVTNQELVSHAWIFPNVITNGHWWYSNTPSFIARDAAARLEAVPRNKQIGYYSDAYKLEFVWPKFDMYRNILADILANYFVDDCGWSEEQAIELGHQVLRGNVDTIFPSRSGNANQDDEDPALVDHVEVIPNPVDDESPESDAPESESSDQDGLGLADVAAGASAALAAGAIGVIEVSDVGDVSGVHEVVDQPTDDDSGSEDFPSELFDTVDEIEVAEVEVEEMDLDPNPSNDEIQAVEVDDVLLDDREESTVDVDSMEVEAEPLDVGDLLIDEDAADEDAADEDAADEQVAEADVADEDAAQDDDDAEDESSRDDVGSAEVDHNPRIHLLRGEESFTPDDDSLQLSKDPITGELTFGQPESDSDVLESESEVDFLDEDDASAGIEATIELDEPYLEEALDSGADEVADADAESGIDLLDFDEEDSEEKNA